MWDRAGFFGNNSHRAKMTKNDQKWPKNRLFGLFKKITSLVLSGIYVKRKFIWFMNILWKLHALKKSGSQVIAENRSRTMRVSFNRQYFINSLISDFDFWHIDKHEWKEQGFLTGFLQKNSHLGKWAILGPKMVHHNNSGSALRMILKFCIMKGTNK